MNKCPNCGEMYSGSGDMCWTCLTQDYKDLDLEEEASE